MQSNFDQRDSLQRKNARKREVLVRFYSFRSPNVQPLAGLYCKRELRALFPRPFMNIDCVTLRRVMHSAQSGGAGST
jgi:hypothetical protein